MKVNYKIVLQNKKAKKSHTHHPDTPTLTTQTDTPTPTKLIHHPNNHAHTRPTCTAMAHRSNTFRQHEINLKLNLTLNKVGNSDAQ